MRWRFYSTASGSETVKAELESLGTDVRAAVVDAMGRCTRQELRRGEVKQLRGRIREIRVSLGGEIYRLVYAHVGEKDQVLLGLHAFHKKTQQTPNSVIDLATRRLKDWERRGRALRENR